MADKRIDELEEATSITGTDLFVLEQANTAKKLTGQTMTNFLLALANGHGGIYTIAKTSSSGTNPVVDTYTITFADNTTTTFQVANGVKGDQGPRGYTGNPGADITITSTSITYQAWTSGTEYPTGTWVDNPPSVSQGGYLWTRTIVNYSDGGQTVAYSVARNGVDGSGAVSTVCGVNPDGTGNVALTASDVGALPSSYQAPVTSVNGDTGAVVLDNADVNALYGKTISNSLSAAGWYRVAKYASSSANDANGYSGVLAHLDITRAYGSAANEVHHIDLALVSGKLCFINEDSVSNTVAIDKVRYNTNGANAYIDLHFTLSSANMVSVTLSVGATANEQAKFSIESLQTVSDAPSGETVAVEHTFKGSSGIGTGIYMFTISASSNKVVTIKGTDEGSWLVATSGWQGQLQSLSFMSGYVSGSRITVGSILNGSNISIDAASYTGTFQFKVSNTSTSNSCKLYIIPLSPNIYFE